jgi:tetratricopeptide (TPR) repeat protein
VPLGIRAESVFRLAPLSVAEGRALFVERAASAGLAHAWSAADLERVDRVCAALDRSPLAIELAAGLAANMSLADIERSLPDRFGLLRTSDPSLPHRHRALEAAIAWSFELLSDAEKRLFARLAVFAASFTFDAALAVAGEGKRPFLSLVEKSMVQRDETNADRYRLLFSLGEFARQRFAEDPQAGDVRARHARYFAELAIAARIDERTRDQKRLLKTIDLELPDLRSALRTLFAGSAPDAALGIEATLALNYYHSARGYFAEGLTALDAARQAAPPGSLDFARVQAAAGKLLFRQRRFAAAKATDEAALAIFRERGTRADVARLLTEIAAVMISLRDPEAARALLDEALPLAVLEGLENTQAVILGNLAVLANAEGDQARFVALTTESARLSKRAGDRRFLARSLDDLAGAEFVAGRHDAAIAMLREALAIVHSVDDVPLAAEITCDLGDVLLAAGRASEARDHFAKSLDAAASLALNYTLGQSLIGLGGVALESGDPRLAARLLGAGASVAAATVPTSVNTSLIARTRAALIERLGEAEFERECRLGEFLEVEDAIALAKGRAARDGTGAPA